MPTCYQLNLQVSPGGGEVFTRFFTEALALLGWESVLVVAHAASFWQDLGLPGRILPLEAGDQLLEVLPPERCIVVTHNVLGAELAARVAARHCLAGIVHMPFYDRSPAGLAEYTQLFAVSRHVRDSLVAMGLDARTCAEPLYGMADMRSRMSGDSGPIVAQS